MEEIAIPNLAKIYWFDKKWNDLNWNTIKRTAVEKSKILRISGNPTVVYINSKDLEQS